MTPDPDAILSFALASIAGPLLTQAMKEWAWVERWATVVNAVLSLAFAAGVYWLWGSGDIEDFRRLLWHGLGGGQVGAVGYTFARRVTGGGRREQPTLGELSTRGRREKRRGSIGLALAVLLAPPASGQMLTVEEPPWQWGPNDLALREEVSPPAAAAISPELPPPAVTLAPGGWVYYADVGFELCHLGRSAGPPPPWSLPGAVRWLGQLDFSAPGVCPLLRGWDLVGCGSLHVPWRQTLNR